jgi:hypothetical protein
MGIDNYFFNNLDGKLVNQEYWDFYLTSDNPGGGLNYRLTCKDVDCKPEIITDKLVLWFDINESGTTLDGSSLTSLIEWTGNTITPETGFTLCDFGLTGVDNGRYDQLSGISVNITSADTKMVLYPVTGYTISETGTTEGQYNYPWYYSTGGTSADTCNEGATVCLGGGFYQAYFKLDFKDPVKFPINEEELNPCDKNIKDDWFDSTIYSSVTSGNTYQILPTEFNEGWTMETWIKSFDCELSGNTLNNNFSGNSGFFFYIGTRGENKFDNNFSGESGYTTCYGEPLSGNTGEWIDRGFDNWFLTKCTPDSGHTGTTIPGPYCDVLSENSLGFRITPDGRIGYRKLTVTGCTGSTGFVMTGTTMEEGYSNPILNFTGDGWSHIVVTYTQGSNMVNNLPAGVLRIWLNGRVVYRNNNFIGLKLRELNEKSEKQHGVPFNISWGGGSQGLLESQTFNGPDMDDRNLLIEQYFTGTFDGKLSQLRFYEKPLNILEIRHNFLTEGCIYSNRYCKYETFGGSEIIQPSSEFCSDCSTDISLSNLPSYLLYDGQCYLVTEWGEKIMII